MQVRYFIVLLFLWVYICLIQTHSIQQVFKTLKFECEFFCNLVAIYPKIKKFLKNQAVSLIVGECGIGR